MFKNNYYKKNKDIIIIPKHAEKHDLKTVVKPNVNKNNYENIRNIVENNEQESISNPNVQLLQSKSSRTPNGVVQEIKKIKNKLNIV